MKVAGVLFDKNSFVFTFDLRSAYHHIDICESHTTYLGFSWQHCGGNVKYYVYRSLPFGASVSGHIFSKTVRVLIKYWRSLGYRIIMFLDDGIGGDVDYDRTAEASHFIRNSLNDFGFLTASEKCIWESSRKGSWLGHDLNYEFNMIRILEQRICRLETAFESLLFQMQKDRCSAIPVKFLASVSVRLCP